MIRAATAVTACDFPPRSVLDRAWVDSAYFRDSYRFPLSRPTIGVVDVFHATLTHHPTWIKVVLIVRNWIAALCGLDTPAASSLLKPVVRSRYAVGDMIGVWPIYALTHSELVAGRDNKHLDFRLSIVREDNGSAASAVMSTVCVVHNTFGKVYLFFIVPFHRWGVRRLLTQAVRAGRL
jgi:hypothetical protein